MLNRAPVSLHGIPAVLERTGSCVVKCPGVSPWCDGRTQRQLIQGEASGARPRLLLYLPLVFISCVWHIHRGCVWRGHKLQLKTSPVAACEYCWHCFGGWSAGTYRPYGVRGLWMDLVVNPVSALPFYGCVMCEVIEQDLMYSLLFLHPVLNNLTCFCLFFCGGGAVFWSKLFSNVKY